MNICLITSSFPSHPDDAAAAAGLFVMDFAFALSKAGQNVTVVVPENNIHPKAVFHGIDVHWFPWTGKKHALGYLRPYRPLDLISIFSILINGEKELIRLHEQKKFDHCFAMWAVPAGYWARKLKKRYDTPYTTWCLGSDIWVYGRYPLINSIIKSILRQSDWLFADGYELCRQVSLLQADPQCNFLPSSRRLDPSSVPKKAVLPPHGNKKFLFVGRYAKAKGIDILLNAMMRYIKSGGTWQLDVYGGGPLEGEIRKTANDPLLAGQVHVHGFARREAYLTAMADCDIFIIPSRIESIPVVLSDAMQMNKPVIVTDTGDMAMLVNKYRAGLVVPVQDPDSLCRAMLEMEKISLDQFSQGIRALSDLFNIDRAASVWLHKAEQGQSNE